MKRTGSKKNKNFYTKKKIHTKLAKKYYLPKYNSAALSDAVLNLIANENPTLFIPSLLCEQKRLPCKYTPNDLNELLFNLIITKYARIWPFNTAPTIVYIQNVLKTYFPEVFTKLRNTSKNKQTKDLNESKSIQKVKTQIKKLSNQIANIDRTILNMETHNDEKVKKKTYDLRVCYMLDDILNKNNELKDMIDVLESVDKKTYDEIYQHFCEKNVFDKYTQNIMKNVQSFDNKKSNKKLTDIVIISNNIIRCLLLSSYLMQPIFTSKNIIALPDTELNYDFTHCKENIQFCILKLFSFITCLLKANHKCALLSDLLRYGLFSYSNDIAFSSASQLLINYFEIGADFLKSIPMHLGSFKQKINYDIIKTYTEMRCFKEWLWFYKQSYSKEDFDINLCLSCAKKIYLMKSIVLLFSLNQIYKIDSDSIDKFLSVYPNPNTNDCDIRVFNEYLFYVCCIIKKSPKFIENILSSNFIASYIEILFNLLDPQKIENELIETLDIIKPKILKWIEFVLEIYNLSTSAIEFVSVINICTTTKVYLQQNREIAETLLTNIFIIISISEMITSFSPKSIEIFVEIETFVTMMHPTPMFLEIVSDLAQIFRNSIKENLFFLVKKYLIKLSEKIFLVSTVDIERANTMKINLFFVPTSLRAFHKENFNQQYASWIHTLDELGAAYDSSLMKRFVNDPSFSKRVEQNYCMEYDFGESMDAMSHSIESFAMYCGVSNECWAMAVNVVEKECNSSL